MRVPLVQPRPTHDPAAGNGRPGEQARPPHRHEREAGKASPPLRPARESTT
jgi:hypothetical protein